MLLFAGGKAMQKGIAIWPSADAAPKGEVTQSADTDHK
jgi:hypothetical protein